MIPVDQRHPADPTRTDGLSADGRQGDCLVCCIATVTELPYDLVPHFAEMGAGWWNGWRRWSRATLGYDVATLVPTLGRIASLVDGGDPATMTIIACGPSPRRRTDDERTRHAVVVDGHLRLLHDPHPSRAGLAAIDELYLFVPIREPAVAS